MFHLIRMLFDFVKNIIIEATFPPHPTDDRVKTKNLNWTRISVCRSHANAANRLTTVRKNNGEHLSAKMQYRMDWQGKNWREMVAQYLNYYDRVCGGGSFGFASKRAPSESRSITGGRAAATLALAITHAQQQSCGSSRGEAIDFDALIVIRSSASVEDMAELPHNSVTSSQYRLFLCYSLPNVLYLSCRFS